jgi:hypothetical protein
MGRNSAPLSLWRGRAPTSRVPDMNSRDEEKPRSTWENERERLCALLEVKKERDR